jgi:signal recognition particle subunit SRP54
MGPLQGIVGMLPGIPKELKNAQIGDKEVARVEAIIRSMTPDERRRPEIINGARRTRIARGSGTTTQEVNNLLKQFKQVQQMMKTMPGAQRMMKKKGKKGKKGKGPKMPRGLPQGGLAGFPGLPQ